MGETVTFKGVKQVATMTFEVSRTSLPLTERTLKELSPDIAKFTKLEELDLSKNDLAVLPDVIGQLKALTKLDVKDNRRLKALPDSLAACTQLTDLDIGRTKIERLPSLPALDLLDADGVPSLDLESVARLTTLTNLTLSDCELETLPDSFAGLKQLQWLTLTNNKLRPVPKVLYELKSLKRVVINRNGLKAADAAKLKAALKCGVAWQ
jgi:Leucine-rich repeat (LRR) protein